MLKLMISKDTLEDLYIKKGLTTYEVAEKLSVCQTTIWKRIHEYKIKPRLPYTPVNFTKSQLKKWYEVDRLSTWEIQKRFGYSRGTINRKLKEFKIASRSISLSHIRFKRVDFDGDILEKAYLIGFRIGDLNVTKKGNQSETIIVKCASTKPGQLQLFKTLFSKYGHVLQGRPTKERKINIQANLNLSFSFLLDKSSESYKWVFDQRKTFFAFLAGFSDAEGCFSISRNKAFFSLGNYDVDLLKKLRTYLIKFGIQTPKLYVSYRKGVLGSDGYISNGDYYSLVCHRKRYLLKLIGNLQPHLQHPDKIMAIKNVAANIINRNKIYGNLRMDI